MQLEITNHSEEVDEILSRPPKWMLRWGLTLLFGFLVVIFSIAYFLRYPDVINAPITVTSELPPVSLIAQETGKIDTLLIFDKQKVDVGDVLAVIENPANYRDVQELKNKLDSLKLFFHSSISDTKLIAVKLPNLRLGEMQELYSELSRTISEYNVFLMLDGYPQKIGAVQKEKNALVNYFEKYKEQNLILAEDLEIGKTKFLMDSTLYKSGSTSKLDYNNSKSVYLQKRYSFQSAQSSLSQTGMQIAALEKEQTELQLDFEKEMSQHHDEFNKSFESLLNQISTWELHFVLKSPIKGIATMFNLSINQPVRQGDELFIISPDHIGQIIGRIKLPIYGSAKVKTGQTVNIKLANYPYEEYGQVSGIIKSISILPKDSSYWVNIYFPMGLVTNTKRQLEFKQEMLGEGEIITENRSVLNRFLGKLSTLF
ncbi:HlyD family efflux transporter periplasmic adaptor subunit [soil metagenome]